MIAVWTPAPSIIVPLAFVLGAALGAAANALAAALCLSPRPSPWRAGCSGGIASRIPIIGWWFVHEGSEAFRLRAAAIELCAGVALAVWCFYVTVHGALLPGDFAARWLAHPANVYPPLLAQSLLFGLMLAASLIDFEEKIIPDAITVPGTWAGLLLAALLPGSLPPIVVFVEGADLPAFDFVRLSAPHPWPLELEGGRWPGLALAAFCWTAWCFALLPRTWYTRHGWRRAAALCWARVRREPATKFIGVMAAVGGLLIVAAWLFGGRPWAGLLTSLTGMAAGGAMIWVVRVVGRVMLGREAMGFGDVTLMAMIGAFLGWQACLLVFFLAPLAGLVIGGVQWLVSRDHEVPYGPFLCLAAAAVAARWPAFWSWLADLLALGWFIALVLGACVVLLIGLLGMLRVVRRLLGVG